MNKKSNELVIGASTGWMYARNLFSCSAQQEFLLKSGANSVEICLSGWDDERMSSVTESKVFEDDRFVYRSVHLPNVGSLNPELQILAARKLMAFCGAKTLLTHPEKTKGRYPVECYKRMVSDGIPLAIENMDIQKDSGFDLRELKELVVSTGCRLVFDVQHAYEHDKEMSYAKDLFECMKDEIAHLHVSGETNNNNHSLLLGATNTNKIVDFLGGVFSVKSYPIILEGEYLTEDDLSREIKFVKSNLGV